METDNKKREPKAAVVKGERKEPSALTKFFADWVPESKGDIKGYLKTNVIIPGIKNLLYSLVTDGLSMSLFGNAAPRNGKANGGVGQVSYRQYYDQRNTQNQQPTDRTPITYGGIAPGLEYSTRGDAEMILETMRDCLQKYPVVTMADMLEFSELTPTPQDYKYGWADLSTAYVTPCNNGKYAVHLPKARPID